MSDSGLRWQVGRLAEATALAVLLALVSAVPVAWLLQAAPGQMIIEEVGWRPLGSAQALALALGAVAPAGLLGGAAGGVAWRWRPAVAPAVALGVAWLVGIAVLPVVATALGIPLRAGIACIDACVARLRDGGTSLGAGAYLESLLGVVFTFYFLAVPAILVVLARATRSTALWAAAWVSLHAATNAWSILAAPGVYAVLLVGVAVWAAWLWARDAGRAPLGGTARRWSATVATAALALSVSAGAMAASWAPYVSPDPQGQLVGAATVRGFNPPDPSDWLPQIVVPRTPDGSGCFDPVVRPTGTLDLCWEAYRDNRETLPGADDYHFRLLATLHASSPTSWASLSIVVSGDDRTAAWQIWPSGSLDGPCRSAPVEGMDVATDGHVTHDVAADAACGRTVAATTDDHRRHWVIWTCARCGADGPDGRQIAVREIVSTSEGGLPTWQVYADLGE